MNHLFTNYWGNNKPLDTDLFNLLMEKKFTMKNIQELNSSITYRTVNHWEDMGYLLSETKEGNWRKFSFTEYFWLLFLNELRELNVGFNNILKSLFIHLGFTYTGDVEWVDLEIEKFKRLDFQKLFKAINKHIVMENICWWIVAIISYKTPITIRFDKGGDFLTIYGNPSYHGITVKSFVEKYKIELEKSNFKSSISISLDSLINNYINKMELDNIAELKLLTDEEINILEELRKGNLKEVTIFFSDGKPNRIKIVDFTNNIDTAKRIKENFLSDYESCEYTTNGGGKYSLKRSVSKKLKK